MPLKKEALTEKAKSLSLQEKLKKDIDVIKKNHQLIKLGKESIFKTANDYLKPVNGPLKI